MKRIILAFSWTIATASENRSSVRALPRCWAVVDQYPHPEEDGVIAFTVLRVLTPILSLVVLFRYGAGNGWLSLPMTRNARK
jgi:hypothetical protein